MFRILHVLLVVALVAPLGASAQSPEDASQLEAVIATTKTRALFRVHTELLPVLFPERFQGGCSFGTVCNEVATVSPNDYQLLHLLVTS